MDMMFLDRQRQFTDPTDSYTPFAVLAISVALRLAPAWCGVGEIGLRLALHASLDTRMLSCGTCLHFIPPDVGRQEYKVRLRRYYNQKSVFLQPYDIDIYAVIR